MLGRLAIFAAIAAAGASDRFARPAEAWRLDRHHIDATPFSIRPAACCDGRPCTPYFCSVLSHGPCIPEIEYPYGENLQLTIETVPPQDQKAKICQGPTTISTDRRSVCGAALLLVAAAGRQRARRACR